MSAVLTPSVEALFSDTGALAEVITDYAPRPGQVAMAKAIEAAIDTKQGCLIEAGTGIGKTVAYLIPAILANQKIIISTGTKNLQDQLFEKDIPALKKILPIKSALLKGRANYVCEYRLKQTAAEGQLYNRQSVADLKAIQAWALQTKIGDIAEVTTVAEDASIWPMVTSTNDNCLNQECPFYQDCYLVKARRQALQAQIVIVNHHLFFADAMLKAEGVGELLPTADVVIFDEAHQLPDIASTFFSTAFSSRQLLELTRDVDMEYSQSAKDQTELVTLSSRCQQAIQVMRAAFSVTPEKAVWLPVLSSNPMQNATELMLETLEQLRHLLESIKDRSEGLLRCFERATLLKHTFETFLDAHTTDCVFWYETYTKSFRLFKTPIQIAEQFQSVLDNNSQTTIFTSATLTVDDQFAYFQSQLGLTDWVTHRFDSPFDYKRQALCYLPKQLPMPNQKMYTRSFLKSVRPLIECLQGRTFLLFTSYAALKEASNWLKDTLSFSVLTQGDAPKQALLNEFKTSSNAILCGTTSFWEGVDMRGACLSGVMIDKLPFLSPGDPIHKARIDFYKSQGSDPFVQYQLPQAVIALKQGVGRLIRDVQDTGVIVIADPRFMIRHYGKSFLTSLPNMPYTRCQEKVEQFIDETVIA